MHAYVAGQAQPQANCGRQGAGGCFSYNCISCSKSLATLTAGGTIAHQGFAAPAPKPSDRSRHY